MSANGPAGPAEDAGGAPAFAVLPRRDSAGFHVLLTAVAILVLGPLGGIAAAYMNFSLGFFVGGQVLAGILGSAVTCGYGPEGRHGANYMQTMAASVASMAGMGVLIQAMVWLEMPIPPKLPLILFFCCIGMFGVGIGMLCTPILVDRLRLEYPSGHAVANILRALTDGRLLRRSIAWLGGGAGLGVLASAVVELLGRSVTAIAASGLSASTIGAGLVVGSRIAVPALVMGGLGWAASPYLVSIGWLEPGAPFRKIGFLIGLAMILGAALVDLSLIGAEAARRVRDARLRDVAPEPAEPWKQVNVRRLLAWVLGWGAALVVVATGLLGQPVGFVLFAIGLTVVFVFVNGIATGISDSNPISSAFVVAVLLMSGLGLEDPRVGLMAAAILLVACSVGVDMQQDRSTGWRLGTNRTIQFRYQVVGIATGAVLCVVLSDVFLESYEVLKINTFANPNADVGKWQSAMTFKLVGALNGLGNLPPHQVKALAIGLAYGLVTEIVRKVVHRSPRYRARVAGSRAGHAAGWVMDAVLLSSPYALSFGGFVELPLAAWFAVGGVLASILNARPVRGTGAAREDALPEDMSATSLVGGGLIAGEALFALSLGIGGLLGLAR